MSAWVQVEESRERAGDLFRVTVTITAAGGIPKELFVFALADLVYSHPTTADDLDRWPPTSVEAENAGLGFYRSPSTTRDFATPREMEDFVREVRWRLKGVVLSWPGLTNYAVPGTESYVISGELE